MPSLEVRIRSWTRASDADVRAGLLAWVVVEFGGTLLIDDLTIRRTSRGKLSISFPTRRSRAGERHSIVRPLDADARAAIERAVFAEIGHNFGLEGGAG